MAQSSLVGLSWIQALRIYFLCSAFCFQQSTDAKECQVTTKHGTEIILTTGPFPKGIYYDQTEDRFVCELPGSCQGYSITGCQHVRCEQDHACQGAHFADIHYLGCHGYDSCTNVTVIDTEMMRCGPLQRIPTEVYRSSCEQAKIQIKNEKSLNCMGPGSCYSQWWEDRMVVNVGSKATVSCGSSTNNLKACGNMVIEVSHGNRACHAKDWWQNCALDCNKREDCNLASIQFRVVGP